MLLIVERRMHERKWTMTASDRGAAMLLMQVEKKAVTIVAMTAWIVGEDREEQRPRWWRGYEKEVVARDHCWVGLQVADGGNNNNDRGGSKVRLER
ncbi:hypothetical protein BHM03_00040692 [Ensete ventricosum]|nr:hypothetical protein BHM03_00040692 [Ensete ventricosum]